MDPITIGLGLAAAGGSALSAMGAGQASAKQGRLQMMEDARVRQENLDLINRVNAERVRMGREALEIKEVTDIEQWNSSRSRTDTGGDVDVDKMMADAERAGFNPVTWLNAGAIQAYARGWSETQTDDYQRNKTTRQGHNVADIYKLMMPDYALAQPSQIPQQTSPLSVLGGALSAGVSALGTQHRANQSYDANMARVLAASAQRGMGLSDGNGYAGSYTSPTAGGGIAVAGLSGGSGGKKDDVYWPGYEQPSSQLWENKKPEATNPFPPNLGWKIPPGYANTETWEDTFGELVSWPYGVVKFGDTILYNTTGKTAAGHFEAARDQILNWKAISPNMTRYSGSAFSTGSMSP